VELSLDAPTMTSFVPAMVVEVPMLMLFEASLPIAPVPFGGANEGPANAEAVVAYAKTIPTTKTPAAIARIFGMVRNGEVFMRWDTPAYKNIIAPGSCEKGGYPQDAARYSRSIRRPVLIFKKFSKNSFLGLPLTGREKKGSWYVPCVVGGKIGSVMLNQARIFDRKRLGSRIMEISNDDLEIIKAKFRELYCPLKFVIPPLAGEAGIGGKSQIVP
jgi:hypothetical protein